MSNQLIEVINQSGLDTSKTNVLLENFSDYFEIASEWETKAKELVVNNISQVAEMKMAREGRLFLREKRLNIEKTRKALKESSLREGQAIDSIAKMLTNLITPIEQDLETKEKFKELQDTFIKNELRSARQSLVADYVKFIPINIDLADFTEVAFNTILKGAKMEYELEQQQIKEAEEQELKKKQLIELHSKRRELIINKGLWQFLDSQYTTMDLSLITDKYFNGLMADLENRKVMFDNEQKRIREENELMREKLRIEKEEYAKKQAEFEELQKKEVERLKSLEQEKSKADKEAKKLAKSPIKKQLMVWVESFDIAELPIHEQVGVDIVVKFEAFKNWAKTQIENL